MSNRLYQLQDGIPFRTGYLPDGNQVLASRFGDEAIAIRFSKDGELLGFDRYPVGPEVHVPDVEVMAVLNQLSVVVGTIRVRAFSVPEYGIETRDMPEYLQEFVDAPNSFPEERAIHLEKAIADWKRSEGFVLVWGEDFEINAQGEVEST